MSVSSSPADLLKDMPFAKTEGARSTKQDKHARALEKALNPWRRFPREARPLEDVPDWVLAGG